MDSKGSHSSGPRRRVRASAAEKDGAPGVTPEPLGVDGRPTGSRERPSVPGARKWSIAARSSGISPACSLSPASTQN
jgi:hypothetical protein